MAVALHLGPDEHRAELLDSVGREVPGVEVRIVDEAGTDVPEGGTGELIVRSDEVFSEYWRDPEATAEALRDGYCWTSDLGARDGQGYVRVVGRSKDVVISGGFNVYPIEVENVLSEHPAVSEVAVIGLPHERWGRGRPRGGGHQAGGRDHRFRTHGLLRQPDRVLQDPQVDQVHRRPAPHPARQDRQGLPAGLATSTTK